MTMEQAERRAGRTVRRSGREPIQAPAGYRRVPVSEVIQRAIPMLAEMVWLIGAITIQIYVPGFQGYCIVFAMQVAYIGCFSGRLGSTPTAVWIVGAAFMIAGLGQFGSSNLKDSCDPLLTALQCVSIMGVFVAEYHRRLDATLIAAPIILLLLGGGFQSIKRNNLLDLWAEGQRQGVNLQALFVMLAVGFGFLLPRYWKLLLLPLYLLLWWMGSRTGFFTALAMPLFYYGIYGETRRRLHRVIVPVMGVVVLGILLLNTLNLSELAREVGLPVAYQRMFDDTLKEGAEGRTELGLFWLRYLFANPTLFGLGIESYGSQFGLMMPHNGYLHVFNGLGIICGFGYFWLIGRIAVGFIRDSAFFPQRVAWAGALLGTILMRKFGEAQLVFCPLHVAGFALCYATGLALWGVERAAAIRASGGGMGNARRGAARR
jgi:hypothetical protein